MAAHVLTALNQIKDSPESNFKYIESALNISCWTEDLTMDEYMSLKFIVNSDQLYGWSVAMIAVYKDIWYRLGCPATREEWINAHYKMVVK